MKQKILQDHELQLMCQSHMAGKNQKRAVLERITGSSRFKCSIIMHRYNAKHQHGAHSSTFQFLQLLIKISYLMNTLTPAHQ